MSLSLFDSHSPSHPSLTLSLTLFLSMSLIPLWLSLSLTRALKDSILPRGIYLTTHQTSMGLLSFWRDYNRGNICAERSVFHVFKEPGICKRLFAKAGVLRACGTKWRIQMDFPFCNTAVKETKNPPGKYWENLYLYIFFLPERIRLLILWELCMSLRPTCIHKHV